MKTIETKTHTIDAKDKRLGRLASRIALLLRGRHKPEFALHKDVGDFVVVKNAGQIQFSGKKFVQKVYYRHSGYLGNLREVKLQKLFAIRPGEVLRKAVWGMLPKNKLRSKQIRRLSIE